MSNNFELFVFEQANKISKNYIDDLVAAAGPPIEKNITFSQIREMTVLEFIDFLGLPCNPPRKIDDETYQSPPNRYMIVSPEIIAFLEVKNKEIGKREFSFLFKKLSGIYRYYEIFIGVLFPQGHVLVVEDTEDGKSKPIGYFNLKGLFDF